MLKRNVEKHAYVLIVKNVDCLKDLIITNYLNAFSVFDL